MLPLLFTVFGCAPPDYVGPEPEQPSIKILFPNPEYFAASEVGRDVCPNFQIVVQVDNFELVAPTTEDVPLQGHWHLYLDDPDLVTYLAVSDGEVIDLPEPLEPGNHTLYAALRQNTHGPLPEEEAGEDVALSEITVSDSPDCIGDQAAGL